jgi:H+/Cl- antiporter ClcA
MPTSLQGELLIVTILGLLAGLLFVLLLVRHRLHRPRQVVALILVAALFAGLSSHAALRLVHYCNQTNPHVDCVPDRYDGALWTVYRPLRRLYRGARHLVGQ